MSNKNIDKLFKDQLKDLEVTPNKKVWNNIESKLKKKKRKVIPFWWFTTAGVAALLILGLFLYPFSTNDDFIKNDSNIIITNSNTPLKKTESIDSLILPEKIEENIRIVDNNTKQKTDKDKKSTTKNSIKEEKIVSSKNAMKKILLANNSDEKNKKVEENKTQKHANKKRDTLINKNKEQQKNTTKTNKNTSIKKIDFNNFIKQKDSVYIAKSSKKNWSISPVFAVLNSNSFSNSSPIDQNLSNTTQGKNSISYGLQVGYQINKKWSIQSGIFLQETNYTNKQITVSPSIARNSTASVTFNTGSSFNFTANTNEISDFENFDEFNSIMTSTSDLNGNLNQNYGYIEIPIEVKYNLVATNKFNTELVAGFSSLFLQKNKINFSTQLLLKSGEATNLNDINFSGNFGFDFNYFLNNSWSFNLNPMIKAQLNTFSKNSNGFAPYNLGLFSGIKYNF
ncbi:hypothetical protein [Polaribacter sargassicola]|uniref:hypothetical protein n=1 Tax=Polaribacter sargassicola TaxID=2836891 RepID=UPI001F1E43AE|nr:hypothetical protein [Polaribacter sp. DS7-9]MCG1034988.1 hypothetical protein [Polaribacter sp. DS7-9]